MVTRFILVHSIQSSFKYNNKDILCNDERMSNSKCYLSYVKSLKVRPAVPARSTHARESARLRTTT